MSKSQKIIGQIKALLEELAVVTEKNASSTSESEGPVHSTITKGCSGAIKMLTDEGFFASPKDIATVMSRLEEIGRYYPQTTVSMNLLNLAKRRTFNRIKNKDTKNWLYVIRK